MIHIELINTGSELMLGRVLNTHQQWLCRQLADTGYMVNRQVAVADTASAIQQAVRDALGRAEVVMTTGGLGPTSDDLTRECIAQMLGKRLLLDHQVLTAIEQFYTVRGRAVIESIKVQAQVPEGGLILFNRCGTAPGLILEVPAGLYRPADHSSWLIMLPGPPRELYPMFQQQVLPWLQTHFPHKNPPVSRAFKTTGLGESAIEERVAYTLKPFVEKGLELAYCAHVGEVEVRLTAKETRGTSILAEATTLLRQKLEPYIFSEQDDTLEAVVIQRLTEKKLTVAVAESCTGGYIAHRLTNVPGASAVFLAGMVTYSNEAKQNWLGVPADLIATEGAVSAAVARAMAKGVRQRNGADYALAVTGIAGPSGGSEDKPVGTVFIALATPEQTIVQHQINRFERENFKQATSQQALEMLRQALR